MTIQLGAPDRYKLANQVKEQGGMACLVVPT